MTLWRYKNTYTIIIIITENARRVMSTILDCVVDSKVHVPSHCWFATTFLFRFRCVVYDKAFVSVDCLLRHEHVRSSFDYGTVIAMPLSVQRKHQKHEMFIKTSHTRGYPCFLFIPIEQAYSIAFPRNVFKRFS